MNEDLATRAWAEHHGKLSQGIADAAHAIMASMKVLQEKQYDAPWRRSSACDKAAKC